MAFLGGGISKIGKKETRQGTGIKELLQKNFSRVDYYCLPSSYSCGLVVTFDRLALSLSNLNTNLSDPLCLSLEIH
jgi:hypothetical protein